MNTSSGSLVGIALEGPSNADRTKAMKKKEHMPLSPQRNPATGGSTPVHRGKSEVLVIDNYDSFTYNLVHYLVDLDAVVTVKRNDQLALEEVEGFDKIVLSPGPGIPDEAGLLKAIIARYAPTKRIFGVCLGLQAIGEVFGGSLINLEEVFHGVATTVRILKKDPLFDGLPEEIEAGRYHSWVIHPDLPPELEVTSVDGNGQVMSLRHTSYDVCAVQFHPESILTPCGKKILENWLDLPKKKDRK